VSDRLRELAERALAERRAEVGVDATVERVVVEVRIAERTEIVTLGVRDDRLLVVASDGQAQTSPAARAALAWVARERARTSAPSDARRRSLAPAAPIATPPGSTLAAMISDLATAIVRSGTGEPESPAILDALARIGRAGPPIEIARWVGRLRASLAARDEIDVARLLDGASALGGAGDLLAVPVERAIDRTYVELGREILDGLTPSAIERRHLLSLADGAIVSEDRLRDAPASTGPCPRMVAVGLAERNGADRLRIVQYAVAPIDAEAHARIAELSTHLLDAFTACTAVLRVPQRYALVEAVSLVRVAGTSDGALTDPTGEPIPLAHEEEPGACAALVEWAKEGDVSWVLGRWWLRGEQASLVPLSCGRGSRISRVR
jgi:hypothetical protein